MLAVCTTFAIVNNPSRHVTWQTWIRSKCTCQSLMLCRTRACVHIYIIIYIYIIHNCWLFSRHNLVGGLEHFLFFHILGIIIPTDFHIFQRGRAQPPTSNISPWNQQYFSTVGSDSTLWLWQRTIEKSPRLSMEKHIPNFEESQGGSFQCEHPRFFVNCDYDS